MHRGELRDVHVAHAQGKGGGSLTAIVILFHLLNSLKTIFYNKIDGFSFIRSFQWIELFKPKAYLIYREFH